MPGVTPRYSVDAPVTYTVKSDQTVQGGQLLEVVTGGVVQPASAGSLTVVGVATKYAKGSYTAESTTGAGDYLLDASGPLSRVAVERGYFKVTYTAAATVGAKLIAAANGQVTPAGATPDARTLVGECAEAAGVGAGAVGLARIY